LETKFFNLIQQGKFVLAKNLLKGELLIGEIIDPRFDRIWAHLADKLLAAANPKRDLTYELSYWNDWLTYFIEIIEPKWGHAHKGHIYFRLGFSYAQVDEQKAIDNFQLAQIENEIWGKDVIGLKNGDLILFCKDKSSYVALCLLEKMKSLDFVDQQERRQFITEIFSEAFDRAINLSFPDPEKVKKALFYLVKLTPAFGHSINIYNELINVSEQKLTYATISSNGALLETIFFSLFYNNTILDRDGKPIKRPTLGTYYKEAAKQKLFPNEKLKAACRLLNDLRNRIHSENELNAKYPLTPRASLTLRILLELTICEWGQIMIPSVLRTGTPVTGTTHTCSSPLNLTTWTDYGDGEK